MSGARRFLCCRALLWRISLGFLTRLTELIVFALFFHDETVQHEGNIDHTYLFLTSYLGLGLMLLAYAIKYVLELVSARPSKLVFLLQVVTWFAVCAASLSITAFFALAIINSRTQQSSTNEFQIAGIYLKLWAFIVLASSRWARLPTLGLARSAFVYEEVYLDDDDLDADLFDERSSASGARDLVDGRGLLDVAAAESNRRDNFFGDVDDDQQQAR